MKMTITTTKVDLNQYDLLETINGQGSDLEANISSKLLKEASV